MPRGCPASGDDRFHADGAALSLEWAMTGAQPCLQVSTQQIELCDSLATDCTFREQVANWFTGCEGGCDVQKVVISGHAGWSDAGSQFCCKYTVPRVNHTACALRRG